MKLYTLSAELFSSVFNYSAQSEAVIIGQYPDCSSFLVLSNVAYPSLIEQTSIPVGYDFTYCQAWGININDDVIRRVKKELRSKELEKMVVTTLQGNTYNADEQSQARMNIAISTLQLDTDIKQWTLANNVQTDVSKLDLKEALQLASTAQESLWLKYN